MNDIVDLVREVQSIKETMLRLQEKLEINNLLAMAMNPNVPENIKNQVLAEAMNLMRYQSATSENAKAFDTGLPDDTCDMRR